MVRAERRWLLQCAASLVLLALVLLAAAVELPSRSRPEPDGYYLVDDSDATDDAPAHHHPDPLPSSDAAQEEREPRAPQPPTPTATAPPADDVADATAAPLELPRDPELTHDGSNTLSSSSVGGGTNSAAVDADVPCQNTQDDAGTNANVSDITATPQQSPLLPHGELLQEPPQPQKQPPPPQEEAPRCAIAGLPLVADDVTATTIDANGEPSTRPQPSPPSTPPDEQQIQQTPPATISPAASSTPVPTSAPASPDTELAKLEPILPIEPVPPRKFNYAGAECGAKVLAANKEAKSPDSVLSRDGDKYMLNDCSADKWVVIELCEEVAVTSLELANLEAFSSMPRDFQVFGSKQYPTDSWESIGYFTAANKRAPQYFALPQTAVYKYATMSRCKAHVHDAHVTLTHTCVRWIVDT